MKLTAVILAGGKSSRIGFNKLEIKIGNVPLLIDQIFKLKFFCDEIIISTSIKNSPIIISDIGKINSYKKEFDLAEIGLSGFLDDDFEKDIKIVLDDEDKKNIGPIMGICKGLETASHPFSIVSAFDMPFISYGLLSFLIFREKRAKKDSKFAPLALRDRKTSLKKDARIFKTEKGFEALCGLYSKRCLPAIKKSIEQKMYKISDFFDLIDIDLIKGKEMASHGIDLINFFNINKSKDFCIFTDLWQNEELLIAPDTFSRRWSSFFFR